MKGDGFDHVEPIKMSNLSTKGLIAVYAKGSLSIAMSSTWDIHCWGNDEQGNFQTRFNSIFSIISNIFT